MATIRVATDGDLDAVAAIYAREVREGTATFDLTPPPRAKWEGLLASPHPGDHFLVAVDDPDGAVLGFAYSSEFRPKGAYDGTREVTIYLDPAAAGGRLADVPAPAFRDAASVTVVLASAGYPESSSKGDVITGVGAANGVNDVDVIHAGTALADGPDGPQLVTAGGRVLAVRAVGYDVADARARAYAAADLIRFDGLQRRTDIAAEPLGAIEGASLKDE